MIKFNGRDENGRLLIGFGLSEMNLRKLRQGLPIHVHADEMGFVGDVLIFYGKTEDDLTKQMIDGGFVDPDTVRDQRKEKKQ